MPQWIQPEYNAIKDDNLHLLDISPLLKWNIYTYVWLYPIFYTLCLSLWHTDFNQNWMQSVIGESVML